MEKCSSVNEAAMTLNKKIWGYWGIVFKAEQTPAIMAPYQVTSQPGPRCLCSCFIHSLLHQCSHQQNSEQRLRVEPAEEAALPKLSSWWQGHKLRAAESRQACWHQ